VTLHPFEYDPVEVKKDKFKVQSMFLPEGGVFNEKMVRHEVELQL